MPNLSNASSFYHLSDISLPHCSMVDPLLSFCFKRLVVSNVAFVLSLFIPRLSSLWCLGKIVLRDCNISTVSSLKMIFLPLAGRRFVIIEILLTWLLNLNKVKWILQEV